MMFTFRCSTYLDAAYVLRSVGSCIRPGSVVCLRDTDREVLENAAKELEVRHLHGVNPDIVA